MSNFIEQHPSSAIYLRGRVNNHQLQEQRDRLAEHGRKIGLCVTKNYCDMEYSFGPQNLPQLSELMDAVASHKFRVVMTWSLSHLASSMVGVYRVIDHFSFFGTRLIALNEKFDTYELSSQTLNMFVSAFSQTERVLEIERMHGENDCKSIALSHLSRGLIKF